MQFRGHGPEKLIELDLFISQQNIWKIYIGTQLILFNKMFSQFENWIDNINIILWILVVPDSSSHSLTMYFYKDLCVS